ncbi:sugar kinase [Cellvibrio sp. pealriver]|uniref:sugar kinase n=1 Tax=Cellvibrio sp. pealriver TaxID=1622269 RepID=UPI00066FD31E|nr:sugar kinase [Cellvibrio sp. pealriver]
MKRIVIIGESMLELSPASPELWQQSFAGDVHSLAVYLKRCAPEAIQVSFMSAVGVDTISAELISNLQQEDIDTSLIYKHPDKTLGLYVINNTPSGERSFQYWRNDSAAKHVMHLHHAQSSTAFPAPDQVFFSGISLAILDKNSRTLFWDFIHRLKQQGTQVIFDPNYRAKLWSSIEDCKEQYEFAFHASNLVLPSLEDFTNLYQLDSAIAVSQFLSAYDIDEIIIKDGPAPIIYQSGLEHLEIAIEPITQVIDTTAAGDSFNGSYLAARARGLNPENSIRFAAKISALVIQHKGAILNRDLFMRHLSKSAQ